MRRADLFSYNNINKLKNKLRSDITIDLMCESVRDGIQVFGVTAGFLLRKDGAIQLQTIIFLSGAAC